MLIMSAECRHYPNVNIASHNECLYYNMQPAYSCDIIYVLCRMLSNIVRVIMRVQYNIILLFHRRRKESRANVSRNVGRYLHMPIPIYEYIPIYVLDD